MASDSIRDYIGLINFGRFIKDLKMKADKLIFLREAAALSGYHPDYLSSLIRNKKIKGVRRGRNWLVPETALIEFIKKKKLEQEAESPLLKQIDQNHFAWQKFSIVVGLICLAFIFGLMALIWNGDRARASGGLQPVANAPIVEIKTVYPSNEQTAISSAVTP